MCHRETLNNTTFPNLTTLSLCGFSVDAQHLNSFLRKLQPQLRSLSLGNIQLTCESWQSVFTILRSFRDLHEVKLKHLSELGPFHRTRIDGHGSRFMLARGTPYVQPNTMFYTRDVVVFKKNKPPARYFALLEAGHVVDEGLGCVYGSVAFPRAEGVNLGDW